VLLTNFIMLLLRFKPDWEKAGEVPGDKLEGKVIDLKERGEYQFRIVAVNKAGFSPPSEPTQMHLVKHKLRKNFDPAVSLMATPLYYPSLLLR
jgi:hypothetical protein